MTDLQKIAVNMQFDTQIINEAIRKNYVPKGMTYDEYLKIKKEEIKINLEEAIKDNIDLIDRANNRIIAWQSINDTDMVEQWNRLKSNFEFDLNDLQKKYDLIFGK